MAHEPDQYSGGDLLVTLAKIIRDPLTKSFEILPGGLDDWTSLSLPPDNTPPSQSFPFLYVEGNLGVPQKVLYKLYLRATHVQLRGDDAVQIDAASIALIIPNPLHQTALNARKRLIQRGCLDVGKELDLLDLIQRGSKDFGKQSTVWAHRQWCLQQKYPPIGPELAQCVVPSSQTTPNCWSTAEEVQAFPRFTPTVARQELQLVHHTCGAYPRNYHGWMHWHFITNVCYSLLLLPDRDGTQSAEFLDVLLGEFENLRLWIQTHLSDYSAMHQQCQYYSLLLTIPNRLPSFADKLSEAVAGPKSPLEQSLSFLKSYPSHEALWMFVRIALEGESLDVQRHVLEEVGALSLGEDRYFTQLRQWVLRNQKLI